MPAGPESRSLTAGQQIRTVRRARRLTQRELARKTGLAEPFLSRIETGRAQPSLRSIERLAEGLGVTVGDLLATRAEGFRPACPVSVSGRCIAELLYQPGPRMRWPAERYSTRQLRLLRLSNYLVLFGGPETLDALETVMHGLLKLPGTRRHWPWLRLLKRPRSPRQTSHG